MGNVEFAMRAYNRIVDALSNLFLSNGAREYRDTLTKYLENNYIKRTSLSIYNFLHLNCTLSLNFSQSEKCLRRIATRTFFFNHKIES